MDIGTINSAVGIAASTVAIAVGAITVKQYMESQKTKRSPAPPSPPKTVTSSKGTPASKTATVAGVTLFQNDDAGFLKWLDAHPNGFVINTYDQQSSRGKYMILHRSTCHTIRKQKENDTAYTGNGYVKVCADDKGDIQDWARQYRPEEQPFTSVCQACKP